MVENKVYYGVLTEILELDYKHKGNIVLFKCEWVDNRVLNKWVKVDKLGIIDVNFRHLFNTGTKLSDEPFILASQAIQVYYVPDPADNGWSAVIQTNPRDFYDMAKVQTENSECENEYVDQCPDLGGSIYITTDPTDVPPFRSDIDGIFVNTNEKRKKSMASGGGNVNNTARNKYEQERAEKIKTNNIALQAVIEKSRELTNLTKGNLGSTSTHQQRKRKVGHSNMLIAKSQCSTHQQFNKFLIFIL
uniref:DUF4216 domain-containing protein n=1 Tax=Oryza brachyantha TaxID=4533 RepID=J3NCU1_ORYBR